MTKFVIINGWAAPDRIWTEFIEDIEKDSEVLLVDWAPKEDLASVIQSFVMADSFVLCGWSLGAMEALRLIADIRDKVSHLILFSPTSRFVIDPDLQLKIGWPVSIIKQMQYWIHKNPDSVLKKFYSQLLKPNSHSVDLKIPTHYEVPYLIEGLQALIDYNLHELVPKLSHKTLIFHGEEDVICPLEAGRKLHVRIKNSHFVPLSNSGHMPFYTHTNVCLKAVRSFIGERDD